MTEPDHADSSPAWRSLAGRLGLPALLAYVPLLLTQPGQVGADTKTYLYLDPARLLSRAPYLWDEHIGAGSVTHQNIGYLWPMGPWYWLFETLGLPDWVAQRLWLATVLFAAAAGVQYLLRTLGWSGSAVIVASVAYMLSPYILDYEARISVILLPFAGLPWLIALTARSLRHGGWRYPACFALVMLTVGGINATALVLIAPGPLLWVAHAVWVEREVDGRAAAAALGRMGALTLATSLWWMAGLWAQGRHGLPVLRFTETYRTVAQDSNAPEVLRGLGYWFFYGRDKLGPWIEPSVEYTNRTALLALSYGVPILALVAAALTRWRHRSFFLAILVVGALTSVGANPWDNSSPLGALFKAFTRTDAGLALRSTPRAVPLVVLATAVFLGAGVGAAVRHVRRLRIAAPALALALVVANIPPLWNGTLIADNLKRPEEVPTYWLDVAGHIDSVASGTRVLEVPGSDFASYRWGNTVDPITPGLLDTPYVARELFTYGSPESASLLIALDRRFHDETLDPDALTTVAGLFGIGHLIHRADLQYERYRTARPVPTNEFLLSVPGLGPPVPFGAPTPNVAGPEQPMLDETTLGQRLDAEDPAPVTVFEVEDARPVVRTVSALGPLIIGGGAEGVVDAAGAGLVAPDQAVLYSATYADDPEGFLEQLGLGATVVLTDTNRQRARRWGTIQQNAGYTERRGEEPVVDDPTDQRLEVFPDAGPDAYTTTEQRGAVVATATAYGNPVTFTPDDRPALAVDGDEETAWRVGAFSDVTGERLILEFAEPVTTDRLRLLQPVNGIVNRYVRDIRVHFDRGPSIDALLDTSSESQPGQTVRFAERTFQRLEIEILDTDLGRRRRYDGLSGVGFAEVDVAGSRAEEVVVPAPLVLRQLGDDFLDHRFVALFTRLRGNPEERVRSDEEIRMVRSLELPEARQFQLTGEARLSTLVSDAEIERLLRMPTPGDGGVLADSSARLPGALDHRAAAALDGDPTTSWTAPFEEQVGHYLEFTLPGEIALGHLDLTIVADGRHSIPTAAFIADATGGIQPLEWDAPAESTTPGATATVSVDFPALVGDTFRLAFTEVDERITIDWYSDFDIILPMAIAEVGLADHRVVAPAPDFDTGCRDDLVTIDDVAVAVRVTGDTDDALARRGLEVALCDGRIDLAAGEHVVRTGVGRDLGIDIDWLALGSDAGGSALEADDFADRRARPAPTVEVRRSRPLDTTVALGASEDPYWLVLGQSHSDGWRADGPGGGLGAPTVVDGYANGWLVPAGSAAGEVRLTWAPQRVVWIALALSALGVLACLGLLWRRRERPWSHASDRGEIVFRTGTTTDRPLGRRAGVAIAAMLGVFALLNSPPPFLPVPVVSVLAYAVLRRPGAGRVTGLLAAGCLASAGAWITIEQFRTRHAPDFAWPQQFDEVHVLGLLTILLLALEATREVATRQRA